MSDYPWVRFFPSDWLGSTRGLSAAEAGIYINLLANMYERLAPLTDDTSRLARLCGASNSSFKATLERLEAEGKIVRKDGGLWNDRVEKEIAYRSEKSEVGKFAADERWKKNKQKQAVDSADAMQSQCVGNANQKPDTRDKEDTDVSSKSQKAAQTKLRKMQFEAFWGIYPRLVGKGAAEKALYKALEIASFDVIMAGVKRYAAQRQGQDPQYTKHPATWLHQECWSDGIGASGAYTQQPMRRGQYRIMRNGEVQHRNDEFDDWYQVDVKADAIAAIALFDYRQPLEAVG
jgi:uncharacterized protein YdaU (DUF1376 family)